MQWDIGWEVLFILIGQRENEDRKKMRFGSYRFTPAIYHDKRWLNISTVGTNKYIPRLPVVESCWQ
jgi:hypothetical protein